MPEIRPFRAWRYDTARAGDLASLISPPYDVILRAQQQELYGRSPFNIIRLELTAPEAGDPANHEGEMLRHGRAKATLQTWIHDGVLRKDSEPALYLYRQSFAYRGTSYTRQSIVAAVRLSAWSSGSILPHERTLAAPRAERLALLRAINANVSPIWALYEDHGRHVARALDLAMQGEPLEEQVAVDDAGVQHSIVAITARQPVDTIRRAMAEHPLFIADGHHRYETALAYRDELLFESGPRDVGPRDYVMMALTAVDDPGLIVLPTHRMVHGIAPERLDKLPEALRRYFEISVHELPADVGELPELVEGLLDVSGSADASSDHRFALLGVEPGHVLLLRLRDVSLAGTPPAAELSNLDVWLSQALLLDRCLGITGGQVERQTNITYTRDVREAARAVERGTEQLALLLAPTPVSQLLDVARAGAVMPQKSTYFYPKLATGLALRIFEC